MVLSRSGHIGEVTVVSMVTSCVPMLLPQELVNLLLCGVAVSNVFNGVMELDSGGAENVMCGCGDHETHR